jgi:hypothetical protein
MGKNEMSKNLIIAIVCTVILLSGVVSILGQKKGADLQDQIITIRADKQALGTIFQYLMETYDIPIGFEESILDREHFDYSFQTNLPAVGKAEMENADKGIKLDIEVQRVFTAKEHPITVNVTNGKLSEVFDTIVSQMTNYKWEVNDGVVNIFPIRGRDERFKELLETGIQKFELRKFKLKTNDGDESSEESLKTKTVRDITYSIMVLKEFGGWLKRNKLDFNPARSGSSILLNAQYGRAVDSGMNFSNVSFRELLNKITKTKRGGWILKWESISNDKEYIGLDI